MKYLIFVVFLLATANAVPFEIYKKDAEFHRLHKRAITFGICDEITPAPQIPLTVTFDTDPTNGQTSKAKIEFDTTGDIPAPPAKALFLTTTLTGPDGKIADTTTAKLCDPDGPLKCPIPKDTHVTINASTDIPKGIDVPYTIEYFIEDGATTLGCSKGKVAAKAPAGGAPPNGPPPNGPPPNGPPPNGPPPNGPPPNGPPPNGPPPNGPPPNGPPPNGPPPNGPPPNGPPPNGPADGNTPPATPDGNTPPATPDGNTPPNGPADGNTPPATPDGNAPPATPT